MGGMAIDPNMQKSMQESIAYSQFMTQNGGDPKDRSRFKEWQTAQASATAGGTPKNPAEVQLETQRLMLQMQKEKADQMKTQGLNPDGSPIQPGYNSPIGADGNLDEKYRIQPWQNVEADRSALDKFKGEAMRDAGSNSPWAKLMLDKLQVENAAAADQAGAGAASSMMQAASRLAQSGGVTGGQRERLAKQGAQAGFIQRQGVQRQGLLDRMNVQTQDEQNRIGQLKDVQSMENGQADIRFKNGQQAANINQYNTDNLFKANEGKNSFDQNAWLKRMEVWGANKQADAQSRVSSGGGKK